MKHRFYLLFTLLVTAWLSATAYDFMVDGIAYNKNSDGNSVTVTYTKYSSSNYNGGSGKLVIPEKVTYSGKDYSVTSIGDYAFYFCSGFTGSLTIPNTVTSIGNKAFDGCSGFTGSLTIPNSVTYIGNYAFSGCRGFTGSLNIPNSVTSISGGAFEFCSGLSNVTIPGSVTSIGQDAFYSCTNLSKIIIPNSVTYIGAWAFKSCSRLDITIPNSVSYIGAAAFYDTSWYNHQSNGLVYAGLVAYDYKGTMPSNTHLIFKNGTKGIAELAFAGKTSLTNIIIPNSVTVIGTKAFSGCTGLEGSLTIPNTVTSIGNDAFSGCTRITEIYSLNQTPPTLGANCFKNVNSSIPLYVPSISIEKYKSTTGWSIFNVKSLPTTSLSLSPTSLSLHDGESYNIIATVLPEGADNKFMWKSSNPSVATVDSNGKVLGVAPGTTTITVTTTDGTNLSASCQITVVMTAKGVSLNKTELTLNDGQSETLVATVVPNETFNKSVTWKSSNTNVATVDENGMVTGIAPGTVMITATTVDGSNLSDSCHVVVKFGAKGVSLNKAELTLNDGQSETLVATVTPSNTYNKSVTWKSSNTAVATVDETGKVTGIAPAIEGGNVTIGTGTSSSRNAPYCNFFKNSTTQSIYTASEIGGAGPITEIAFKVASTNSSYKPNSVKIYMGHKSGLFSSTSDFMTTSNLVEVYSGSPSLGAVSGWETINLTTPFNYNGIDNLVVVVCKKSNTALSTPTYYYTAASPNNYCLIRYNDNNADYGNISNITCSYSSTTVRPNIKITIPTAIISATTTDGTNLSSSCLVTVVMRAKEITLNKSALSLNDGQSETLIATVTPYNTSNKRIVWKSSNSAVVSVNENGMVTAKAPGTATITATTTDGTNLSASCQITVVMTAKGVSLNKTELTLNDGQSETLVATITPDNTSNKALTWKSSNTAVATVDETGKVTGVAPGNAIITATTTDGTNLSASCPVTVIMKAKEISLNKSVLSLKEGQSETLIATVIPSNTSDKTLTWKSSNTTIATVDTNGKVTGVATGTATITATTNDGTNLSASCGVTVISNKLYTDTIYDFFGGENIVVAVKMKNSMQVAGFQTDLEIPYYFDFAKDSDGYHEFDLSDRASRNHSIGTTSLGSKKVRVLSYSSTNKTYSGNDGELFYFTVNTQWDASIQTYSAKLTNTEFSSPDGMRYDIDNSEIKFRCYYIPGDANHDKKVSIADIIAEARQILLQNPEHFHYKSANVNEDEKISVSDIALTANIILGRYNPDIKFSVQRMMGGDVLSAGVVESRGDGSRTIAIALDGNTDFTAFQADLCLPEGMEIIDARLSDRAGRSHTVALNCIGGNTVRVLSYASDNAVFAGNSGNLLLIDVKGRGEIEMKNALFAEPNGCEHELDEITFSTELSGINDITVGNAPVNVYNTAGQLIRTNVNPETATQGLPAGFYLVGNKKVVVK